MLTSIRVARLILVTLSLSMLFVMQAAADEPAPNLNSIEAIDALTSESGWLLADQRLYRTQNGGQLWDEVTLSANNGFSIAALDFVDDRHGWLALLGADANGVPAYALLRTSNSGATWATFPLVLFQPGEPEAYAERVWLHFLDEQTGWLTVKQSTSRNFNVGTLFKTTDGGETWTRLTLPIGEPVYFESAQVGWVQGGVTGEESYRTEDGGATWQPASPDAPRPPEFWTLHSDSRCDSDTCSATTQLRTSDGRTLALPSGASEMVVQVTSATMVEPQATVENSSTSRWLAITGHGFDSCTLPPLSTMQTWYTSSPYRVWNLYIGGSARAPCGTLTASHIAALAVQGWRFIPTWVGPQAACYTRPISRMSWDPATAYQQGLAEADAAVNRAAALGLTFSNDSGSVLYYDLEAYPNDATCRAAAQAFMNGWTQRVRERGNIAGVYGTPCTSYLSDFVANPYVPDAVWLAGWYLDYFDSQATVWLGQSAACLSNSLWSNHQRLRQYTGGHNETWGGLTINIDSNVLDGPIASLRDPSPLGQAAEFYRDFDYVDGSACSLNATGWFNAEECGAGWNDEISSLRLRLGWSARVFRDTNLSGPSYCYVLSDPDHANDRFDAGTLVENNISSVKVYDNVGCVDYFTYLPFIVR